MIRNVNKRKRKKRFKTGMWGKSESAGATGSPILTETFAD